MAGGRGVKPTTDEDARLELWEKRLQAMLVYLPYTALVVSVLLAATVPVPTAKPFPYCLSLSVAALGWLLLRSVLDRYDHYDRFAGDDHGRLWVTVLHFSGLIALIFLMTLADPVFGYFGFAGYLHAMRYLRGGWRIVGGLVTAMPVSVSQTGGMLPTTSAAFVNLAVAFLFNVVSVGAVIALDGITERQSNRRKASNAALSTATVRLAAMLAENRGLHAQLISQAREAGVLDERQRMAREIHDTLAQALAGIVTQLHAADQARERGGPDADRRHLVNAARLAREGLADARRAVRALRPEPLEQAGLPAALAEAVGQWRELHGTEAKLTITGTARPLHPEVEITLLRAAQEALANVAKHAGASRVGLTLSYMEDVVTLDVRDDGAGFDPLTLPEPGSAGAEGGGFGLTVMRQRVRRLSGRLEVESECGGGTAVSATLPAIGRDGLDG
ncbi:sensor histidine kinase [Streptantibioticus rubrisoli]|uniref:Sensor histidine kinase n=1 Tax=Streptantibioticus rubrisoli TaxID=1387313 RepID=A0ABT1P798_9ACTN|nr:sensor histidine kinase [Streptantibioticus rubrisoli]MCQ4040636.1 sensor histidine kinase [Streptantibioticus rubrisoli]